MDYNNNNKMEMAGRNPPMSKQKKLIIHVDLLLSNGKEEKKNNVQPMCLL